MEEMARFLLASYLRNELDPEVLKELEPYLREDPAWRSFRRNGGDTGRNVPDTVPEEALSYFRAFLAKKLRRKAG